MQLRPGYPWLLISGYFVAMFLVGSASVSLARSLVANAMQVMQQTTFPIERSLTRVESWSLYHRLAIVSNQRHIVTAMTAPALPAPFRFSPPKWTLRNRLICPDPQAYFRLPLNR